MAELAENPIHSASEHATTSVPTASPDELLRELRSGLAGRKFEVVEEVVVLEDGVAIGLVTLESLLARQDGQQILRGRDHPRVLRGCPDG